jgi:hypothetical protein
MQRVRTGDYRFYDVPWQNKDGELFGRVPCFDQVAWCRFCCRLRCVERIPEIAFLEGMKKAIAEAGVSDMHRQVVAALGRSPQAELQQQLAKTDEQIRWRRERKSPAKCFVCGSADIEPLDEAKDCGERFRHPNCGGVFEICEANHFQPARGFLIPSEGPRVRRGFRYLWAMLRCRTIRSA